MIQYIKRKPELPGMDYAYQVTEFVSTFNEDTFQLNSSIVEERLFVDKIDLLKCKTEAVKYHDQRWTELVEKGMAYSTYDDFTNWDGPFHVLELYFVVLYNDEVRLEYPLLNDDIENTERSEWQEAQVLMNKCCCICSN